MTGKREKQKENYLKMPNHIRNIRELGYGEKELLAHIYSFGRKGCWQSNETLGKMFFRSERTISLWIANLKKGKHILWLHPKGYYRTLWAKSHQDVRMAEALIYRDKEIPKDQIISGQAKSALPRNKLPSKYADNCEVTTQKPVFPLRKKLLHTNNTTTKDINKRTKATPAPLPAGGQAPALLEDRKAEQQETIKQFTQGFGNPKNHRKQSMTDEQKKAADKELREIRAKLLK